VRCLLGERIRVRAEPRRRALDLRGALTFAEAGPVLAASATLPLPRDGIIDCSGIGAFDSAAVAVLLAIKRRAAAEHKPVVFIGLQGRLEALAKLYDVEEILAG
jgi:ABC-type transporter Mla MlaB component